MKVFSKLVLTAAFAVAAGAGAQTTPEGAQATPRPPATVPREERERLQKLRKLPAPIRESTAPDVQGEEVPLPVHVRAAVLEDATRRAGVKAAGVTVMEALAVTWPDGSLGCPERNVEYPQLPLAGYRVVLQADGKTYDYRVASPRTPTTPPGAPPADQDRPAGHIADRPPAVQVRLCDPTQALNPLN